MRRVLGHLIWSVLGAACLSPFLYAATASLPEAAELGDRAAVISLLKSGADANTAQADGMTALHWAALKNDADLAGILLAAGANPDATTRLGGYTPLLLAAREGNVAMVAAALKGGANPSRATSNGTTPLMLAAASGQAEAVSLLLGKHAAVNATEVKGQTALMFAAAYGRTEVIKALVESGADVKMASTALDLTTVAQALEAPAGATTGKNLVEAASESKGRGKKGGGVNPYNILVAAQGGLTPMLFATRQGHSDAAKVLLDAGADINQPSGGDRTTPLLMATINGHFDLAKLLLERGANPRLSSENGVTPLYAALNCQWAPRAAFPQPQAYLQQHATYLELMNTLLDEGADPNARVNKKPWYSGYNFDRSGIDETGATAFWRAAYAGDVEAMRLLVAHGADPNIWTAKSEVRAGTANETQRAASAYVSPLPVVPPGGPDVSALLASAGIGYTVGYSGNSHVYSPNGMLPAVKYMVEELQMDVNVTDALGNTAVHLAAARGDNEMIRYLLSKGANPLAINREGLSTVDMANAPVQKTTPFPETIALLEKLGAVNHHRCMSC
ncbi:MAG: ankyrin repeat domain-containing protein [Vicinamibacterales bacterium]